MVDGEDGKAVEMDQAKEVADTGGRKGYQGGGNLSRSGGDGYMIGHEWERKWEQGTQERQREFAKDLDIKVETVVSGDEV